MHHTACQPYDQRSAFTNVVPFLFTLRQSMNVAKQLITTAKQNRRFIPLTGATWSTTVAYPAENLEDD
jgi:hypothetical protein